MADHAKLVFDVMDEGAENALRYALERLYESDALRRIWPAALDSGAESGRLPLCDVEIVVLPLDRVGAPPGASGAEAYVAYYAHQADEEVRRAASHPVVVKIGSHEKLCHEIEGCNRWPELAEHMQHKFAFPLEIFKIDSERAVLIAPFRSGVEMKEDGRRNKIEVRDLWRLLEHKAELDAANGTDWTKVRRIIAAVLDDVRYPHHHGMACPAVTTTTYAEQYEWYLRGTKNAAAEHIPQLLFGKSACVDAFGRGWPNPNEVVRKIIDDGMRFSGILGAVHGDLHPKNIVLTGSEGVQVIDFGWATNPRHVVTDYVLLDLNLRGTTLPSQIDQDGVLSLAGFLRPEHNVQELPKPVRARAQVISEVIWAKANKRAIAKDWTTEYLIPLLLVGYGLLVHLDAARNQLALIATVLQLSKMLEPELPKGHSA